VAGCAGLFGSCRQTVDASRDNFVENGWTYDVMAAVAAIIYIVLSFAPRHRN
jgi:hypothetical protein